MRNIKTLGLIGWLIVACSAPALAQQGIPWARDLRTAQESAAQQHKLLLLHFWTPDCAPCQTVDRYVFSHPEVARAVAANYVPVSINGQAIPDVAKQFGVDRYPTDVILSSEGEVLSRTVSPKDAKEYIALVNRTAAARGSQNNWGQLAASQKQQPPTYQASSFQSGGATNPQAPGGPVNSTVNSSGEFASNPPAYRPNRPTESTSGFGQYGASPASPDPSTQVVNPHAAGKTAPGFSDNGYGVAEARAAGYGPRDNASLSGGAPQTSGGAFGGGEFNAGSEPPAQQWIENNRPATAPMTGRATENRQVTSELPLQPANKAEKPPLALSGYCPVSLVEGKKWRPGSVEFGAIHRGRTYLFVGQREQAAFLADPDRYSPVLSGFDPVRFLSTGEFVEGKREHGVFYHDQIFLFADEAALARFGQSPDNYARTVHEAMLQNVVGNRMR